MTLYCGEWGFGRGGEDIRSGGWVGLGEGCVRGGLLFLDTAMLFTVAGVLFCWS